MTAHPSSGEARWVAAARLDELVHAQTRLVQAFGQRVLLVNLHGQYYAIDEICPHDGGALSYGWVEREHIVCPLHFWRIHLATGRVTYPDTRQPNVRRYPVRIHDGHVWVDIANPS